MTNYYVYIVTNRHHTVLYTGMSDDVERRTNDHKRKVFPGFTAKYNCDKLVYFEEFAELRDALAREKQLKRYRRQWKENLIDQMNPRWKDLSDDFTI